MRSTAVCSHAQRLFKMLIMASSYRTLGSSLVLQPLYFHSDLLTALQILSQKLSLFSTGLSCFMTRHNFLARKHTTYKSHRSVLVLDITRNQTSEYGTARSCSLLKTPLISFICR